MSTLTLPGLSTGIDTAALVQQLVLAGSQPMKLLQARQATVQNKTSALATLESRVGLLKTSLEDLRSAADLRSYTTTSNNEQAVTAESTSEASEGSHEILVDRLASAERKVHAGLAALDTTVGAGAFAYTYDGETRTIVTTADTTLEGLRDLINNDGGNPGVTASLLEYDAGDGKAFHLVLGGNDTGADFAIAIDDVATTLDAFDAAGFTTTQAAQNSRVRVDGYPASNWIERSGNTLDDVLAGVTLHLSAASTDPVRINLSRDTASLKAKLQVLITSYNNIVDYAQQKTAYDPATKTGGVLLGEYTVTNLLQQLRSPLTERATGFLDGADAYSLAAQIGLSVDRNGKLTLDDETLDEALADNYLAVLDVLGTTGTGASDSVSLKFYGAREGTDAGTYSVKAQYADSVLVGAWIKKSDEPESAWRAATVEGNLILGADGQPEQGLQVVGVPIGAGTVQAEVRVRQGVAGRMFDTIEDSLEDAVDLTQARFQTEVDMYQKSIDREQLRLERMQTQLTAQYARLEQTLTLLKAQQGALTGSAA